MYFSKKSLGPVVATGLFIVVAVVATISFQVWFQDYSSQVFADVESGSEDNLGFQINNFYRGKIYFSDTLDGELTIYINEKICEEEVDIEENYLKLDNCLNNLEKGINEITVEYGQNVLNREFYVEEKDLEIIPTINYFNFEGKNNNIIDYEATFNYKNSHLIEENYNCFIDFNGVEKRQVDCRNGTEKYEMQSRGDFYTSFLIEDSKGEVVKRKIKNITNFEKTTTHFLEDKEKKIKSKDNMKINSEGILSLKKNYPFNFEGSSSEYIDIGDSPELRGGGDKKITVSAWIKPRNFQGTHSVVSKQKDTTYGDWGLDFRESYSTWDRGDAKGDEPPYFQYYGEDNGEDYGLAYGPISMNEWINIAFTLNLNEDVLDLYYNGEKVISDDIPNDVSASTDASAYIGNDDYYDWPFEGEIGEIKIYEEYLSENHMKKIYQGKELENKDLVAFYDMLDNSDDILYDVSESSYDHDGVISNVERVTRYGDYFGEGKIILEPINLSEVEYIEKLLINKEEISDSDDINLYWDLTSDAELNEWKEANFGENLFEGELDKNYLFLKIEGRTNKDRDKEVYLEGLNLEKVIY